MSTKSQRVMKFGGSSVATSLGLLRISEIIDHEREHGHLAVVLSAMGDITDSLIAAARMAASGNNVAAQQLAERVAELARRNTLGALDALPSPVEVRRQLAEQRVSQIVADVLRSMKVILEAIGCVRETTKEMLDSVMAFGERLSAPLLTELLSARGLSSIFVDSRNWIVTDDRFGDASVDWEATEAKIAKMRPSWGDSIVVTTGFLGQTIDGRTTTLGRSGSDYTATLLARALHASSVDFWTDVPGVMTADPALVSDAYPLTQMTYMEALELANFGARVFHPQTMIPLIESGIPLRIRSVRQPELVGTLIDSAGDQDRRRATSVTSLENLALIDVESRRLSQQVQLSGRVLNALHLKGITVWMATQSAHGQAVAVVVPEAQVAEAVGAIRAELATQIERKEVEPVRVRHPITLLTLVAEAMGQTPNVAGRFFHALGSVGINVHAIAQGASSRSVSCAIDASDTAVGVRTVHASFHFAHEEVNLVVLGVGTVGRNLLAQVFAQAERLKQEHRIAVRVVGLANSRRASFDQKGYQAGSWSPALDSGTQTELRPSIQALLESVERLPVPILVDCTAVEGMERVYEEAFRRGIHVVAANKKPLTIPWPAWQSLMRNAREHHRGYQYETTVGASLPVIETLKDLIRTGDEIEEIEGALSGTLGYLTNELMRGIPLSTAMLTARDRGYTEPRPQDDLSGVDVARKMLILAREIGLPLSLEDIQVEPMVPMALITEESVDRFFQRLKAHDPAIAETVDAMRRKGTVLRYLARIQLLTGKQKPLVSVGPVGIDSQHPATRLRGAEAFIAFTTARYREYPLIIQGAGAGGAVTASGVLADILKVAQRFRGN